MKDMAAEGFRFIDLFAGIGGLRRGFESIGGTCVLTCEWDRFARKTYAANFPDGPDHPFPADIRDLSENDVPDHDVLLAGFPCQPFSIAGVSKKNALGRPHGFECDTQGTMFHHVARILRRRRPPVILLENVKDLLGHDRRRTFAVIASVLDELGYDISHRIIDAKAFVPQHRERIFIVGVHRETGLPPIDLDALGLPDVATGPKLGTILHPEDGSEPSDGGADRDLGGHQGGFMRFGAKHDDIHPILADMIRWKLDLPNRNA